jgi:hypothetical protein
MTWSPVATYVVCCCSTDSTNRRGARSSTSGEQFRSGLILPNEVKVLLPWWGERRRGSNEHDKNGRLGGIDDERFPFDSSRSV